MFQPLSRPQAGTRLPRRVGGNWHLRNNRPCPGPGPCLFECPARPENRGVVVVTADDLQAHRHAVIAKSAGD